MTRLRAALPSDAGGIARVHVDSWRAAYRGLVPDSVLDALDYAERTARWEGNLASGLAETYVAVDESQLVGFASIGDCRDADAAPHTGEVFAVYVAPSRVRSGIGTMLIHHVVERARARRYRRLTLWVLAGNAGSREFYRAIGFAEDGTELEYSLTPDVSLPKIRMTLRLGP